MANGKFRTFRQLDADETVVVKEACRDFLRKHIGANLIYRNPELELLVVLNWQDRLDEVMLEITAEFFEWFERQEV